MKRKRESAGLAEESLRPAKHHRHSEDHDESAPTTPAAPVPSSLPHSPPKASRPSPPVASTALSDQDAKQVANALTPLLALPAELRKKIWAYALHEPGRIKLVPTLQKPSLLWTSRQIRSETHKLYLTANAFEIKIRDFDITLYRKWCDLRNSALGHDWCRCRTHFRISSSRNFDNLIEWCRWLHGRSEPWEFHCKPSSLRSSDHVVLTAVHMTINCRKLTWEGCKSNLEILRSLCGALNQTWKAT